MYFSLMTVVNIDMVSKIHYVIQIYFNVEKKLSFVSSLCYGTSWPLNCF